MFLGPDTACFVMDPTRAGAVLARHAGIDEETGQLAEDGDGPRRLVISSDFYSVYTSAGKKADGLVNLYCWAHIRRYFVRAGDANPAQLTYWTAAWLDRIKALYAAHEKLMAAWAGAAAPAPPQAADAAARLEEARAAWDDAIGAIDEARKQQMAAPGLQEPRQEGARHAGPGMGRADRAPRLPDDQPGQLSRWGGYADVRGWRRCRRWSGRCPRRIVRHSLTGFRGRRGACPGACSGRSWCAAGAVRSSAFCLSSRSACR